MYCLTFINNCLLLGAPDDDLSEWATAKVNARMEKSANWKVIGIDQDRVFEVRDTKKRHIVDLEQGECTCRQWQLSGLPCGHVCAVGRFAGLTSVKKLARPWFYNSTLKGTYKDLIYPLKDVTLWDKPADIQVVSPPLSTKRAAGRPKKRNRIPSQGEVPTRFSCGRCGGPGHNRLTCNAIVVKEKVEILICMTKLNNCWVFLGHLMFFLLFYTRHATKGLVKRLGRWRVHPTKKTAMRMRHPTQVNQWNNRTRLCRTIISYQSSLRQPTFFSKLPRKLDRCGRSRLLF